MPVMRRALSVLLLPVALASLDASAAVVEDFYRVELPLTEDRSREEVVREGTQVMLTRLAGERVEEQSGVFSKALEDPRSLMRRIANTEGGTVAMEFEPALLRELLASAGSPMLGRNRPGVLVWAVDAQPLGDELVGQGSRWADALRRAAEHRAVPVSFPLGDLEDRGRVSEADIRQGNDDQLIDASQRYGSEGVLAVGATTREDRTSLKWAFWLNGKEYSGEAAGEGQQQAADQLMKAIADVIFQQYSVPATSDSELTRWTIIVQDVGTLEAFAGVQRMVQQLGARSAPQLLSVNDDKVTFQLAFPGDQAQLERMLALDQRIQRSEPPEPKAEPELEPLRPAEAETGTGFADDAAAPPETDQASQAVPGEQSLETIEAEETIAPAPSLPEQDPHTLYYRWR